MALTGQLHRKDLKINKKEQIYKTLLDRILFMEYAPGEILNELTLAEEFGTSRGPLREILKRLEYKKLVLTMPRLGTQVAEIDFQKIIQAFKIRLDIETLAAKLACENATQDHIDRFGEVMDNLNIRTSKEEKITSQEYIKLDIQFRDILYEAALNPILKEISDFLYHLTLRIMILAFDNGSLQMNTTTFLEELKGYQVAFDNGDVEKAGEIRRNALKHYLEGVKSLF